MANYNAQITGLGSATINTVPAGTYYVKCTLTVPALQEGSTSDSAVVTTIKLNGTTMYTSNPGDRGVDTVLANCPANSIILVTLTSTLASDATRPRCTIAVG